MEHLKNEMNDFIINGKFTIKKLYELAKQDASNNNNV